MFASDFSLRALGFAAAAFVAGFGVAASLGVTELEAAAVEGVAVTRL